MRFEVMISAARAPWLSQGCSSSNRPSADCNDLSSSAAIMLGDRLRKQIGGGLADDGIVRQSELGLGHPVDQHIAAVAHVLDRDLRRDVIDDLAQERVVAVALLFEDAALGDVLDGRDPAALRQRLVDDLDDRPSAAFRSRTVTLPCATFRRTVEQNSSTSPSNDPVSLRCWIRSRKWQPGFTTSVDRSVHIDVALVADDDAGGCVVQHEALRHVVERGVEPVLFRFQPPLRFPVLPGDLPDDQQQDDGDRQRGQNGGDDQKPGLRAPVGERRAETVVVATTTIGKWLSSAAEPSRSRLSTGLATRRVCRPPSASTFASNGADLKFCPIIASAWGWRASIVPSRWNMEIAASFPSATDEKKFSNFVGEIARETTPMSSPSGPAHLAGDDRSHAAGKPAANQFDLLRLRARL